MTVSYHWYPGKPQNSWYSSDVRPARIQKMALLHPTSSNYTVYICILYPKWTLLAFQATVGMWIRLDPLWVVHGVAGLALRLTNN